MIVLIIGLVTVILLIVWYRYAIQDVVLTLDGKVMYQLASGVINPNGTIKIEFDVKTTAESGTIFMMNSVSDPSYWNVSMKNGIIQWYGRRIPPPITSLQSVKRALINDNEFHRITLLRNGSTYSISVDGIVDLHGDGKIGTFQQSPMYIGCKTDFTNFFIGQIKNIKYNDRIIPIDSFTRHAMR
jgi:hypothetical protein